MRVRDQRQGWLNPGLERPIAPGSTRKISGCIKSLSSAASMRAAEMGDSVDPWRVPFCDGNSIPILGLGTCSLDKPVKGETVKAVKAGIEIGYRHFDGALMYGNEDEVGEAIRAKIADGTVKREDIFYTSKLSEGVLFPQDASGKILLSDVDFCETWAVMESCKDAGLVRSIGVSNFNHKQLETLLRMPKLKYRPVCNQVECHPYLNQSKLLKYCKSNNIVLVGYSPLGTSQDPAWFDPNNPILLNDPELRKIGEKHNKTAAQVALRYQIQRDVVVIPKSFNPGRMKQNKEIFDFQLTNEEMKAIDGINKNLRYITLKQLIDHPKYPFHEEY
ncbi:prostaglandin F synthase 2-like isoform X3 [Stegostoma tigrinum]|uniref:prostaglandin F synthase 2-like isoform X3 n=1 Tax=Stegostoma tigrinum TaxID=3053191 RepID=UPI00287025F3|nr:prostaglandin F synthase 2-like isoform X3 [Stegostoma tigrinum]